jgi:hypothetical protein
LKLALILAHLVACGAGDGGDDEGPYYGPEVERLWPNPCRATVDIDVDGSTDTIVYYELDGRGRVATSYDFTAEGEPWMERRRTYDGRRLKRDEEVWPPDDRVGQRTTYEWDENLVVGGTAVYYGGDGDDTTVELAWEYDELGRVTAYSATGYPNLDPERDEYQHLDADRCPDVIATYLPSGNTLLVHNTNLHDCQVARSERDKGMDGIVDFVFHTDFDAGNHPLVTRYETIVEGQVQPNNEWRYSWDGDLMLTAEYVNLDGMPLIQEMLATYAYDCPEGIPDH